ncbi:MAG: RNA polymerase sigma factor [Acidobacteriia bacterium]|nr:RNA polymerase sigma factor [Terriglobia bacterium]
MTGSLLEASNPPVSQEYSLLVKRAKAGDIGAFEELMIRHERRVFLTALRLLGHPENARDAAQDVFLRFHRFIHRVDEQRDLAPWLYRMTVNACHDIHRKQVKVNTISLDEFQETGEAQSMVPSPHPDENLSRGEEKRIVAEALKRLPEKERTALVLRDIEGLSTGEVARILGSSEGTVRSQVSMARLKIKKFTERLLRRKP